MTDTTLLEQPASNTTDLPIGWRVVRFGDVVRDVKMTVDPVESGLERYVAGEHMQTDDLHIRQWGTVGDGYLGPAFHRKFVAGQVLYGSRRTYLRKVAVADFDGICANTTFVLEPLGNELIPDLLPFIMQTESFVNHSMQQSRGSTNPYVTFKDLAWYEFALPPRDEQRRIAEILWAADEAVEASIIVIKAVEKLIETFVEQFLSEGSTSRHSVCTSTDIGQLPASWQHLPCEQLLTEGPRNGLSPEVNVSGDGYPTLSISAVRNGSIDASGNIKYAVIDEDDSIKFRLHPKDVLVVRGNGNKSLVGKCGIVREVPEGCFYPDLLIRLKFNENMIRPEFATLQWNTISVHKKLIAKAKSTNGIWKVNGKDLRQHLLAVPTTEEQDDFMRIILEQRSSLDYAQKHLERHQELKRNLLKALLQS